MSREIKFRGLTKPTRESPSKWVYGYYSFDGANYWITDPKTVERAWIVLPETVGQFTGLKDKNKEEAYSGDKLKDATGDIGVIYWKQNIAGFYCKWSDGSDMPINTGVAVDKCEIIDNIHENPELKASPGNQEDMD